MNIYCKGLRADAESARPLRRCDESRRGETHDNTQKNNTDCHKPMISAEQHTGLESDRQQARGQVWSKPATA